MGLKTGISFKIGKIKEKNYPRKIIERKKRSWAREKRNINERQKAKECNN